jgi:FRG domain
VKNTNPQNVSEFLTQVSELRSVLEFEKDDPWGPWFRGQQRHYWPLCPKLYRDYGGYAKVKRDHIDDEIREEFIVRAPILSDTKPAGNDDWEWYFLMQHFGTPTRLLDWTEGALLGLYFAVKDNPGFYDSAVWVLDPFELNRRAIRKEEVIPPSATGVLPGDKRRVDPWLPPRFKNMAGLPKRPVAVYPTHIARRISTQRSCFTVHGTDVMGLDRLQDSGNRCLLKIVIPSFRVQAIRRELEASGIDEATIFPDLAGLSRALSLKWKSDEHRQPHEGVYARIRPSGIHKGGVGVFAIRKIKKGTPLFEGDNDELLWVEEGHVPEQPKEIRNLYADFPIVKGGRYGCPPTFNRLTVAWYLNEPRKGERANVGCTESYDFFALRDIRAGVELTVDYSTYSESPLVQKT